MIDFLHRHPDILQVVLASGFGTYAMFQDIELGLKIIIGCITTGYLIWKWVTEYKKEKEAKNKFHPPN